MFESLRVARYRVVFEAVDSVWLRQFSGSTFRGALGHAFKRVSCALPRKTCPTCLLRERCAYSVCFETPVPQGTALMRKYPYAPHPFVIEPPEDGAGSIAPGASIALGLTLIGRGNEYLPQFIYAFEEMGQAGLGRDRATLALTGLDATDASGGVERVYDHSAQRLEGEAPWMTHESIARRADILAGRPLRLTFKTPTRIKTHGALASKPALAELMPGLLRRLTTLAYFHCDGPEEVDVKPLLEGARAVDTTRLDTQWVDWERYSGRQKTRMRLGGFVGALECAPPPRPVLEALLWGELLHLGKASAFGLGRYEVGAQ